MWHKIFFNSNNIVRVTPRAILIKMPNKSKYIGYTFWHPAKLVREQGGKGYHMSFSFTEDFTFTLKKYGAGRHNFMDVISEHEINPEEMLEAFGVVNKNVHDFVEQEIDKINEKIAKMDDVQITIEHHIPEKIAPIIIEPNKNLIR